MAIEVGFEVPLEPRVAFDIFVDELAMGLGRLGMQFEPGTRGRITQDGSKVGRVAAWDPGREIQLEWHAADWQPAQASRIDVRFEPLQGQTHVTFTIRDWEPILGGEGGELMGWFAGEMMASLLRSLGPKRLGDWITDRRARQPSGLQARTGYRDPVYHRPNFKAILKMLALTRADYLLEVGCGGGAFLQEALRSGCRAAGIDHSPDMVEVAKEVNSDAINDHRLQVLDAEADRLPFSNSTFTCSVMTNVFGWLPDPVAGLSEVHRVLKKNGWVVIFVLAPEARGTIAAPEPIASRFHACEDVELRRLASQAGFLDATVERPSLEPFALEAGFPPEEAKQFAGQGGQFLWARKG